MFDPKTSPFVVIDVETTGLLPAEDRVVEVGAIRLVGGKEDGRFHSMIQPGRPMPEAARAKNGITDDMLKDAPTFDKIAGDLRKFMAGGRLDSQQPEFRAAFFHQGVPRAG